MFGSTQPEQKLTPRILACRKGSIVAPAGCGKTEEIANAGAYSHERRLILTHTLAGVDAIRRRLIEKGVKRDRHDVTTIASWALRFASAFPQRSSLIATNPADTDWPSVYAAATRLLKGAYINTVIKASYAGLLVDEYQDCTRSQHELIIALATLLPCCIFGDRFQAIFDFRAEPVPDWEKEVLSTFPVITYLKEPHRWIKEGNRAVGTWLLQCRKELWSTGQIDLSRIPANLPVYFLRLSTNKKEMHRERVQLVYKALARTHDGGKTIIIADRANERGRALLASKVTAANIEPVSCKRIAEFVDELPKVLREERLALVLDLVKDTMTGTRPSVLRQRIGIPDAKRRTQLRPAEQACLDVSTTSDIASVLRLLETICQEARWIYRRELHSIVCHGLREFLSDRHKSLADAVWHVQNQRRYVGRSFGTRNMGSTLLVKGLQFEHVIITDVHTMTKRDLYVAMTRGSRSITVIAPSRILRPKQSDND